MAQQSSDSLSRMAPNTTSSSPETLIDSFRFVFWVNHVERIDMTKIWNSNFSSRFCNLNSKIRLKMRKNKNDIWNCRSVSIDKTNTACSFRMKCCYSLWKHDHFTANTPAIGTAEASSCTSHQPGTNRNRTPATTSSFSFSHKIFFNVIFHSSGKSISILKQYYNGETICILFLTCTSVATMLNVCHLMGGLQWWWCSQNGLDWPGQCSVVGLAPFPFGPASSLPDGIPFTLEPFVMGTIAFRAHVLKFACTNNSNHIDRALSEKRLFHSRSKSIRSTFTSQ